jgi:leader peptidase (prepilin peptidase)/N-methyltransferase
MLPAELREATPTSTICTSQVVEVVGLVFLAGLIVGSFLNVCIHRIPAEQSVVWPGSRCPSCAKPIRWYDNIPVLSYIALGGRCRDCKLKIPLRYPAVELLTGAAFVAVWGQGFPPKVAVLYCILTACYIAISFIDFDHKIIPDVISIPSLWVAPLVALVVGQISVRDSLVGIAIGGGILWAIAAGYEKVRKQEGMGFGDVKLLAMVGGFQGWQASLFALIIGSVFGTIVGVSLMVARRGRLDMEIPFGPFIVAGALLHMFGGPALIDWYFGG